MLRRGRTSTSAAAADFLAHLRSSVLASFSLIAGRAADHNDQKNSDKILARAGVRPTVFQKLPPNGG
jgi:hypothetical protein